MDRKTNLAAKEKVELLKQQLELQNKIVDQYKQQLENDQLFKKLMDNGYANIVGGQLFIDFDKLKDQNRFSDSEINMIDKQLEN